MNHKPEYVTVIYPVDRDLEPRFHGLAAETFSRVPANEFDKKAAMAGRPLWREGSTYQEMAAEMKRRFPEAIVIGFDRYDHDRDMVEAMGAAFRGELDIAAHNKFRHIEI